MNVCVATVTELPGTGPNSPVWLAVAALALVLGGVAVVAIRHRRRAGTAGTGVLGILVVGIAMLVVASSPPAQAATIDYGTGCSLIDVAVVSSPPEALTLLPGDDVSVVSVNVTNRFTAAVVVDGDAAVGAPLDSALTLVIEFNGAAGPITLAPGETALVSLRALLPTSATNSLQGITTGWSLTLTASE